MMQRDQYANRCSAGSFGPLAGHASRRANRRHRRGNVFTLEYDRGFENGHACFLGSESVHALIPENVHARMWTFS